MFGKFAALIRDEQLRQARVRIIELEHALQDLIDMADHDALCRQFGEWQTNWQECDCGLGAAYKLVYEAAHEVGGE